jgi:thiamine biosynthesis lipoprotein
MEYLPDARQAHRNVALQQLEAMSVASPIRSQARQRLSRRDLLRSPARGTATTPVPVSVPGTWIRVHRAAMACRFEVTLAGEDQRHLGRAHEALGEADRIEAAWSVFRETSALSDLNRRAADEPVGVDAELFTLLARCAGLHRALEGAFDISTTPLIRCWRSCTREGRLPSVEEIAHARAAVGLEQVTLDAEARAVRFARPGVSLNLGAIGKGYAVGAIAAQLRGAGVRHALVSAGASSIVAVGGRGGGWTIDVRSRQAPDAPLARLRLRDGAMATSGAAEQFVEIDGRRYGHVIDPRTGWPASGLLSVTVITADAADADALATAFFVGGVDLARRYCERDPDTLVLLTPDPAETLVLGRYPGARLEPSPALVEVS